MGRTAELARTFGIDFFAVLFRGSQYRVESMMARLAHTQNYLLPSPSKEQVPPPPARPACPLHACPDQACGCWTVHHLTMQTLAPEKETCGHAQHLHDVGMERIEQVPAPAVHPCCHFDVRHGQEGGCCIACGIQKINQPIAIALKEIP